jgi:hypothetical protein
MHLMAQFLFWTGRFETVILLIFLIHALVFWLLRGNGIPRWLTAVWFIVYVLLSLTLFSGLVLMPATRGTPELLDHLYGGTWSDSQALSSILLHWSNVWLPIYIPWLTIWILGLLFILFISALAHGPTPESQ